MSAYLIIEASVRDKAARERYSSQAGPILRKFYGEVLAVGPGYRSLANPQSRTAWSSCFRTRQ